MCTTDNFKLRLTWLRDNLTSLALQLQDWVRLLEIPKPIM